jgi:AmpE protein
MIFLALILALLLAFSWDYGRALHRDGWFMRWRSQLTGLGLGPVPVLVFSVLVPCLVVQFALNVLEPLLFGACWIVAAAGLLLYGFGRGNVGAELEKYRSQCRREDFEAAYLYGVGELGWFKAGEASGARGPHQVHALMQRGFLYHAYQHWFAVVFYFLLLGPVGALAYRLLQLAVGARPFRLMQWVDWVPARLLAASFTLTGNFVESADELLAGITGRKMEVQALLYSVAMAATGEDKKVMPGSDFGLYAARQNELIAALVRRSFVAWVVVVSLGVLLI